MKKQFELKFLEFHGTYGEAVEADSEGKDEDVPASAESGYWPATEDEPEEPDE